LFEKVPSSSMYPSAVVGVRHDCVVVLLHLGPERVVPGEPHVRSADHAECAARAQQLRRLRVAKLWRDPVEGGEGDDGVESRLSRLPGLEVADLDLHLPEGREVAARHGRQLRGQLDARHGVPAACELHCRLAGAGPDLEQPCAGRQLSQICQVVEDGRGIDGAGAVVLLGHRAERLAQTQAVSMLRHG
jgi:hypothetical protein